MSFEEVRLDDSLRDTTAQPEPTNDQKVDSTLHLAADEVPLTDSSTFTKVKTYTVAAEGALVDLAAANAVAVDEDTVTVTTVTYTPAGNQTKPASGQNRIYLLKQGSTTVASYTFSNSSSNYATGSPVSFALGSSVVTEGELTLESAHGGTVGVADPGGTLTVTYVL